MKTTSHSSYLEIRLIKGLKNWDCIVSLHIYINFLVCLVILSCFFFNDWYFSGTHVCMGTQLATPLLLQKPLTSLIFRCILVWHVLGVLMATTLGQGCLSNFWLSFDFLVSQMHAVMLNVTQNPLDMWCFDIVNAVKFSRNVLVGLWLSHANANRICFLPGGVWLS